MRTTLTLDSDVANLLEALTRERGLSFKEAVNTSLRNGLRPQAPVATAFRQKTFAMGAEQHFRWDKALSIAEAMEDEEIARKLATGK